MEKPVCRAFFAIIALFGAIAIGAQDRGLVVAARAISDAAPGRQIAVLIAVDRYKEWLPLKNPVKDARELREILVSRYYIDDAVEIYDEDATKAGILRRFDALIGELQAEDSVLIYYAGHGHLDKITDTGFWIPKDAGTDPYEQRNWIANSQVRGLVSRMKARHVALISDSCFAGELLSASRDAVPAITDEYFRNAFARRSRQVLTSGASETVPDASSFSSALKRSLAENRKPFLDPLMLFGEVRLSVTGTTPLLGTLNGTDHQDGGSFLLFLRTDPMTAGASQALDGQTASLATGAGRMADLMVRTEAPGPEIWVDGILKGKSPLLVEKLPAGRSIRIEAKTALLAGTSEVILQAGELRDLTVALAQRTGHLVIVSNESQVRLLLDGEDKGALGAGIFRDLGAGEHEVELVGQDLYWSGRVSLAPESSTRLEAKVSAVGKVEVSAPPEALIRLSGQGVALSRQGGGLFDRVPVGSYRLNAEGEGYQAANATILVQKGQAARWTAWTTGRLEFPGAPAGAVYRIEGRGGSIMPDVAIPAKGLVSGIAPGELRVVVSAPGYHDRAQEIRLEAGRTARIEASLEIQAPGSLILPHTGVELIVMADSRRIVGSPCPEGLRYDGIPSGKSVRISFECPVAKRLDIQPVMVNLKEGESFVLDLPAGSFTLPWLAPGARVSIGGKLNFTGKGESFASPLLPAGSYQVSIGGTYASTTTATIASGSKLELPGYRAFLSQAMDRDRSRLESSIKGAQAWKTAGIVSVTAGLVGAAGFAAAYFLDPQAKKDENTDGMGYVTDDENEHDAPPVAILELAGLLLTSGALTIGPIILIGKAAEEAALRRSLDELDTQIKALGN